MKKTITIILVILVALGLILVGTGLILTKGNLNGIFEQEVRTEMRVDETGAVTSVELDIASDDIELYPSEDGLLHIEYWDSERRPITYSFSNGIAKLNQIVTYRSWFSWGLYVGKTIKLYLPESANETFSIKLSSGNIVDKGCNLSVETFKLELSSGDTELQSISATTSNIHLSSGNLVLNGLHTENLTVDLSSGDFSLNDSEISGKLDLDMSSGNAVLNDCVVSSVKADLSSGSFTAKGFTTTSVDAHASSGNIVLHLCGAEPEDYSLDIDISSGSVTVNGFGDTLKCESDFEWGHGDRNITCHSSSGNIEIYFE